MTGKDIYLREARERSLQAWKRRSFDDEPPPPECGAAECQDERVCSGNGNDRSVDDLSFQRRTEEDGSSIKKRETKKKPKKRSSENGVGGSQNAARQSRSKANVQGEDDVSPTRRHDGVSREGRVSMTRKSDEVTSAGSRAVSEVRGGSKSFNRQTWSVMSVGMRCMRQGVSQSLGFSSHGK